MKKVTLIILVSIVILALEIFLSYRKNKWQGLIMPSVFFVLISVFLAFNVVDAFSSIQGFGGFLQDYGNVGIWALVLKIGFAYTPVIILLIAYFVSRAFFKSKHPDANDKEMKKMMAKDL